MRGMEDVTYDLVTEMALCKGRFSHGTFGRWAARKNPTRYMPPRTNESGVGWTESEENDYQRTLKDLQKKKDRQRLINEDLDRSDWDPPKIIDVSRDEVARRAKEKYPQTYAKPQEPEAAPVQRRTPPPKPVANAGWYGNSFQQFRHWIKSVGREWIPYVLKGRACACGSQYYATTQFGLLRAAMIHAYFCHNSEWLEGEIAAQLRR